MLIDFREMQLQKFDELARKIVNQPQQYIHFDSVSDFYKAPWLNEFPQGTHWYASGLDDGAEDFYAVIEYKNHALYIDQSSTLTVRFIIR